MENMNRKQFIQANEATCDNWTWSWSFVNESERLIIFGAWDFHTQGNKTLIFSEDWQSGQGRKKPGYTQSREHIRLIEEEGYKLMTFSMQGSDANGTSSARIESFTPRLDERVLSRDNGNWYASEEKLDIKIPEEVESTDTYVEGAVVKILVNSYERNRDARQKCLDHYGYDCAGCGFNFEAIYGILGRKYIHVHHLVPIHTIQEMYQLDPIKDLIPVCPNCHAMIHRENPALTIEELKNRQKKRG